jgi:dihydroflavonol-4-reductase
LKTAFVTGATGCVGINLVEQLVAADWKVHALHRKSSNLSALKHLPVEFAEGVITDLASLERALPEGVDVVFHVAGNTRMWSPMDAEQTRDNVEGTRNVLRAARSRKARRFVHTSTALTYGVQPGPGPFDESTPSTAADSWINYIRSKYLAEQEVKKAASEGLDVVILNPCNIIGPHDTSNWSRLFKTLQDKKLSGVMPGASTFGHVRDVARAHVAAAERGRSGENYILGGVDATYLQLVQAIARLVDRESPPVMSGLLLSIVARFMLWGSYLSKKEPDLTPELVDITKREWFFKSDKAARELGFHTTSLDEMVTDCYRWMLAEGRIKKSDA